MTKQTKTILFVCEGNKIRSQMAEAFYRQQAGPYQVASAGTLAEKDDPPSQLAIEAMKELGIDISRQSASRLTQAMIEAADLVVIFPTIYQPAYINDNPNTVHWNNADPYYFGGHDAVQFMLQTRDDIRRRVVDLIAEQSNSD